MSGHGFPQRRDGSSRRRGGLSACVLAMLLAVAFVLLAAPAQALAIGTYEDGSAGFFEWLGETDAATKVKDARNGTIHNERNFNRNIGSYQKISPDNSRSAFNLDNMRQSLGIMEKCNSLRARHGLDPLTVDPSLMAISQILANYSSVVNQHASVFEVGENYVISDADFNVDQAFRVLYDEEKSKWESSEFSAARQWFDGYEAEHGFNAALNKLATTYPTAFNEAGHYLNIINPEYVTTGSAHVAGALDGSNRDLMEQSFGLRTRGKNTYTVDRFEELLEEYLDLIGAGDPGPGPVDPDEPSPGSHKLSYVQPAAGGTMDMYIDEYQFPGESVWLELQVFPGYYIENIYADGVDLITWSEYANVPGTYSIHFTMPDQDVTVYAILAKEGVEGDEKYSVSVGSASHGKVSVDYAEAPFGWMVTVFATPDAGYKVGAITVTDASGKSVPTGEHNGQTVFFMPESNVTVKATFVPDEELSITVNKSAHGRVTVDPSTGVKAGDRVTVALWPDNLYIVKSVKVTNASTGESVKLSGSGATRFFTMPDASVRLEVIFGSMFGDDEDLPTRFSDVHEGEWFVDSVKWVSDKGIMNGEGDGTSFNPNGKLDRSAMAQLLYNMEGKPSVDQGLVTRFPDCSVGAWYSSAVAWACKQNVMTGYENGNFGISDKITREQFATVIWRMAGEPTSTGDLSAFPDASTVSEFSYKALRWAVAKGIITGDGGKLSPVKELSRAEAATMLMRWKS